MERHQLRGIAAAKPKLSERDCRTLKRIVSNNHRTAAAKLTAELNIRLEDCFHKLSLTRASQIHLFKMTIRPYTLPEVFSLVLMSMKMHFSIFPGQHGRQT